MAYARRNRRGRGRKVPRGKKQAVKTAVRQNWKKSVAAVAKRVIANQSETKQAQYTVTCKPCNTFASAASMVATNVFCLTPYWDPSVTADRFIQISQGTGEANRVGNEIRLKSLKGKVVLYPAPYNTGTNPSDSARPTIVTFWCVSPKQKFMSPTLAAQRFDLGLYDDGNAVRGYQSQLLDLVYPINNDMFTVHFKRSYKLGHATTDNGIVGDGDQEFWTNNDYKMNHILNFNFTKFAPKIIRFQDSTEIGLNKTLYLFVGVAKADGSAYASGSNFPVDMYLNLTCDFTDM